MMKTTTIITMPEFELNTQYGLPDHKHLPHPNGHVETLCGINLPGVIKSEGTPDCKECIAIVEFCLTLPHESKKSKSVVVENIPKVGQGATLILPQDRYPYVVVKVSKSGKTATLKRLHSVDTRSGHSPEGYHNGFPVWNHTYTEDEIRTMVDDHSENITVRLSKSGHYKRGHSTFIIGKARYYRDFSDD